MKKIHPEIGYKAREHRESNSCVQHQGFNSINSLQGWKPSAFPTLTLLLCFYFNPSQILEISRPDGPGWTLFSTPEMIAPYFTFKGDLLVSDVVRQSLYLLILIGGRKQDGVLPKWCLAKLKQIEIMLQFKSKKNFALKVKRISSS